MSSRERFEAWYLQHMKQASGLDCSAREIAGLRDDQGYYGEQRHYLNGCWSAWQARDAEVARLVEALRQSMRCVHGMPVLLQANIDALLREYDHDSQ